MILASPSRCLGPPSNFRDKSKWRLEDWHFPLEPASESYPSSDNNLETVVAKLLAERDLGWVVAPFHPRRGSSILRLHCRRSGAWQGRLH